FLTAGSSTLEDAVFANSPIALSFSSASLLGMPYFLASSETRVLATVLLLAQDPGRISRPLVGGAERTGSSRGTHRVLMSCCSSLSVVGSVRSIAARRGGRPRARWTAHP